MTEELRIAEEQRGDVLLLRLVGRLDVMHAPLCDKVITASASRGVRFVVLDLSGVEYLSSAGLRVLLAGSKSLEGRSGKLLLAGPAAPVLQVLKMSGFDRILPIFLTEDEAVESLRGRETK